jgi:hypothetical protein
MPAINFIPLRLFQGSNAELADVNPSLFLTIPPERWVPNVRISEGLPISNGEVKDPGDVFVSVSDIDRAGDLGIRSYYTSFPEEYRNMRSTWWTLLTRANLILGRAKAMGLSEEALNLANSINPRYELEQKGESFFVDDSVNGRRDVTPHYFKFVSGNSIQSIPYSIVIRIIRLYHAIFNTQIAESGYISSDGKYLLTNTGRFAIILDSLTKGINKLEELTADADAELVSDAGNIVLEKLSVQERTMLKNKTGYKEYFSSTFNSQVISSVPIIHNFYLTSKHFQKINTAFESPKDQTVNIILSTIRNDESFNSTPILQRTASDLAKASANGTDQKGQFNTAARDFIIKMLIKTPIDILKGLVELIDPHVAVAKLIKNGTGLAFNEAAKALDIPAQGINEAIAAAMPGTEPNFSGENLMKLVLCLADQGMQAAGTAISSDVNSPLPSENFFPRISIDGLDLLGTGMGMLMIPPSPLGLLYLLLQLIKNSEIDEVENINDASAINADNAAC